MKDAPHKIGVRLKTLGWSEAHPSEENFEVFDVETGAVLDVDVALKYEVGKPVQAVLTANVARVEVCK